MTPKRRSIDTGHVPTRSTYEILPESASKHEPARIRRGADRDITHEVIAAAIKEWRRKGRRIRRIKLDVQSAERRMTASGHLAVKVPSGFTEVEMEEEK